MSSKVDVRQLQVFTTVAATGSLTRAADRLHLSQPALSMQLRALQQALGVQLFARTGRGLRLTEAGERLLEQARAAVTGVSLFEQAALGLADPSGAGKDPLSIGTILDPDFIRLGEFLRRLFALAPQTAPELRHGVSGWVLRQIKETRLDFGFYLGEAERQRYALVPIARVRYVVIAPRGWDARLNNRGWRDVASLPWIWTPPESVHNRLLTPIFRDARTAPTIVARVDQEASMLDLVRAGVGLSLAREAVALREAHHAGLAIARSLVVETDLSVVALRTRAKEPAIRSAFAAAKTVWGDQVR
jgi:DNA-binding transcriptional LysR family regulator